MLLPFTAVILSILFFGKAVAFFTAILALIAVDYFYVGEPSGLEFSLVYIVEGTIFIFLGFLISRIMEQREKAEQDLVRLKDEFLFMTAHDLRAPFSNVTLILEKYNKLTRKISLEEIMKDMKNIQGSMQQALALTDRLTTLAQSQNPYLQKNKVSLNIVLTKVLQKWRTSIEKKDIRIEYLETEYIYVLGDQIVIEEILDNLIGNAVKYNVRGGKITIRYKTYPHVITISISDTGMGIHKDNLKKIFLPYFRGEHSGYKSGSGLGLYIVKKLTERLGGSITADSSIGHGSTFYLTLLRAFPNDS
jgi:two-component system phosphate regulon sensor histidine kinase PhoR